ncbi:hypothetical protein [Streptomyces sp. MMBL 11-3]|uniref:hypothetical protein n=1 Tax=Streptomyces sp. MMBL 11-3 TaxID=3382639 RepID=UPI0039B5AD7E
MDSTTAAGWIGGLSGLGGAIVGAGSAAWATWRQQRHEIDLVKAEREASRHDAAFEAIVQTVFEAKDLFRLRASGKVEENWKDQLSGALDRLRLSTMRMTSAELRTLLEDFTAMLTHWRFVVPPGFDDPERLRTIRDVIDYTVQALGAYDRQRQVPPRSESFNEAKSWVDTAREESEADEQRERENHA